MISNLKEAVLITGLIFGGAATVTILIKSDPLKNTQQTIAPTKNNTIFPIESNSSSSDKLIESEKIGKSFFLISKKQINAFNNWKRYDWEPFPVTENSFIKKISNDTFSFDTLCDHDLIKITESNGFSHGKEVMVCNSNYLLPCGEVKVIDVIKTSWGNGFKVQLINVKSNMDPAEITERNFVFAIENELQESCPLK